jgi:cytidylate kinase
VIVTISRDFGAATHEVAHELGDILGYEVVGENFSEIVGARLGITEHDVEAVESRAPTLVEWMLENLLGPVGSLSSPQNFEEKVRREIEATILEAAARGNVVIVGGVSNIVLRDQTDMLSIFLHAPLPYRIGRLQSALGIGAEAARDKIQRMDAAKRRWAKVHYNVEWGAAWYYDLAVDVSRLGIAGTASLIASTVRALEPGTPPAGQNPNAPQSTLASP